MDEGKLLLFIKDEVASRAPRRGRRLDAERQRRRKRKAESPLPPSLPLKQRRGHAGGAIPVLLEEGDDDESCSDLVLMYNTVRGYCSAVNEL